MYDPQQQFVDGLFSAAVLRWTQIHLMARHGQKTVDVPVSDDPKACGLMSLINRLALRQIAKFEHDPILVVRQAGEAETLYRAYLEAAIEREAFWVKPTMQNFPFNNLRLNFRGSPEKDSLRLLLSEVPLMLENIDRGVIPVDIHAPCPHVEAFRRRIFLGCCLPSC